VKLHLLHYALPFSSPRGIAVAVHLSWMLRNRKRPAVVADQTAAAGHGWFGNFLGMLTSMLAVDSPHAPVLTARETGSLH